MILIIHPFDITTKRLGRVASFLHRHLPDNKLFVVHPKAESKERCHQAIMNCTSSDLIIFLGHGNSYSLYGARGRYYNIACPPERFEDSDDDKYDYYDEFFINEATYHLFKNKKLICYACKSAELAKSLSTSGAVVILGFGVIPTSSEEFSTFHISNASQRLISCMKGAITRILKHGFTSAISSNNTFADLFRIMEFEFQREIERAISSNMRNKVELVNTLQSVKREMTITGDIQSRLL